MKKAITVLVAMSIVLTSLWLSSPIGSAQQSSHNDPRKDDDPLTKSLKKNWDKLPPQAKLAADPRAKEAWDKLTPRQQELLKAKVRDIIRTEKNKADKEKQARMAALKTWDDVIKSEGPGEDETLSYVDNSGNHHSFKAKRHDGSIRPQQGWPITSAGVGKKNQSAHLRAIKSRAPWEDNWAFDPGQPGVNKRARSHHASRLTRATIPLTPQAGCSQGPEQFVRIFFGGLPSDLNYGGALARPPSASQLSYWMSTIAQAQSQGTTLTAGQNLGTALFTSTEYSNRNRDNGQFLTDLYAAYLGRVPDGGGYSFWLAVLNNGSNRNDMLNAFAWSAEFQNRVSGLCDVSSFDGDHDGLPDSFENAVADAFAPSYHVSAGETDNYSTFEDFVPQTVKQRFGQTPVSHFRVLPLSNPIRFNPFSGRTESFLRIDYLTLWDQDSGFVGDFCFLDPSLPTLLIPGSGAHELDNERSGLLISAPVPDPSHPSINLDPNAYSALSIFTSAHEGTLIDESMYHDSFDAPKPAPFHQEMWQSLSKHSTYTFDPDFFPVLQLPIIVSIFIVIELFFFTSCDPIFDPFFFEDFNDLTCIDFFLSAIHFAAVFLLTCWVERFVEQGITETNVRINVGEPPGINGLGIAGGNPINGSGFILDDSDRAFNQYSTLLKRLRFESVIP